MGRTIPSYRIALDQEYLEWKPFRKALGRKCKKAFDDMLLIPSSYISACSGAVKPIRLHPIFMAILHHHYKELLELGAETNTGAATPVNGDSLLAKEIQSWDGYRDVLRKQYREPFEKMLSGLQSYEEAVKVNGELRRYESLFMALISEQQEMITALKERFESPSNRGGRITFAVWKCKLL